MAEADAAQSALPTDTPQSTRNQGSLGRILLAALALILLVALCGIGGTQTAKTPDITGMTLDEARAALEDAGFDLVIEGEGTSGAADGSAGGDGTTTAGGSATGQTGSGSGGGEGDDGSGGQAGSTDGSLIVATQSPSPGSLVLKGTRVIISLSSGTAADGGSGTGGGSATGGTGGGTGGSGSSGATGGATGATGAGGTGGTGSGSSSTGTGTGSGAGSSGGTAAADDHITIVPSTTSSPTDSRPVIPFVGNMTQAAGTALLQGAGYSVTIGYGTTTAGVTSGHIYAQEPPFYSHASPGTTVKIWVSTGAPAGGEYPTGR
ncbi:MAG: PASTA domain-containing protein [Actinobacteria bacterium]|nr:PASTA domain-containing protein [Actinomycetota bacterium]